MNTNDEKQLEVNNVTNSENKKEKIKMTTDQKKQKPYFKQVTFTTPVVKQVAFHSNKRKTKASAYAVDFPSAA